MKLTIKIKRTNNIYINLPRVIKKGDWVDLYTSANVVMNAPQAGTLKKHKENGKDVSHRDVTFDFQYISLGVAMKLPKGFEAVVLPRSSTLNKFGIIQANSQGVIDSSYCGNNDEWKYPAIALKDTEIEEGSRICQFRIQLSQKATVWQKIKWLFTNGIRIKEVESLEDTNRGGFGSTGVK